MGNIQIVPRIAQSFTVGFPRAVVWPMLAQVERVVMCMPGASLTQPPSEGKLAGEMRVKLGPIVAAFAGEGEIALDDAAYSGVLRGQGLDRKNNSRARAEVEFKATEADGATRVDIAVDYSLTGTLAQFSRGALVEEITRRLCAEFARNLEARLTAAPGAPVSPTPDAPALNAGALALAMIRDWFRGLIARLFGRGPGEGKA